MGSDLLGFVPSRSLWPSNHHQQAEPVAIYNDWERNHKLS